MQQSGKWRPLVPEPQACRASQRQQRQPSLSASVGNIEQNVNTVHVENQIQVPLATLTQFPVWRIEVWFASAAAQALALRSDPLICSLGAPDARAVGEARQRAGDAEQALPAALLLSAQRFAIVYKAPGPLPPGTRLTLAKANKSSAAFYTGPP